jgi:hypothetical protein
MKKSLKIPKSNQNPYIKERKRAQEPREKGQTTIYKILHIKLNIERTLIAAMEHLTYTYCCNGTFNVHLLLQWNIL